MVVKTKSRTENDRFHFSAENIHIFHLLIDKDDLFSFDFAFVVLVSRETDWEHWDAPLIAVC